MPPLRAVQQTPLRLVTDMVASGSPASVVPTQEDPIRSLACKASMEMPGAQVTFTGVRLGWAPAPACGDLRDRPREARPDPRTASSHARPVPPAARDVRLHARAAPLARRESAAPEAAHAPPAILPGTSANVAWAAAGPVEMASVPSYPRRLRVEEADDKRHKGDWR